MAGGGAAEEASPAAAARSAGAAPRGGGRMLLSSEDHVRIELAVATAERATRGEIVCVVTDEVGPYAEVPLAWAAVVALVIPLLMLAGAGAAGLFDYAFGGWVAAQLAATHVAVLTALTTYALLQCTLFVGVFV